MMTICIPGFDNKICDTLPLRQINCWSNSLSCLLWTTPHRLALLCPHFWKIHNKQEILSFMEGFDGSETRLLSIWILGQNSYETVNCLKQLTIFCKIFDPPQLLREAMQNPSFKVLTLKIMNIIASLRSILQPTDRPSKSKVKSQKSNVKLHMANYRCKM